jgi:hypothetical protein
MVMIQIYRSSYNGQIYDSEINHFHKREYVLPKEVRLIHRELYNGPYVHAEPAEDGMWAFGGSFLYTSNGVYEEFNKPIPLHDRNMALEGGTYD